MHHFVRALVLQSCALLTLTPALLSASPQTALDRYVHTPDPAYEWHLVNSISGQGITTYVVEMTSQTWLTTNEVDRPLWKHWLTITKPDEVKHDTALLFIGGGSNESPAPTKPHKELATTAIATASIVAELRNIPNQPLTFTDNQGPLTEDGIIATTWDRYLRTGDERWPARLPMTKGAVRAMDTITAFCASKDAGELKVDKFFVAGGSKRGWTTWTTAIVDQRVVGICPIVIDCLNVVPSFIHHWEVYGFYAPAVQDYESRGIMEWQNTPEYAALMKLVDPYSYRDRLTMPKFIMNATGDQFFLPDSSQFYFDDLPGQKYLRYVPNGDHSLRDTDAYETLAACFFSVLNESKLPKLSWEFTSTTSISANSSLKPDKVLLWQASNPDARDFRVDTIGKAWTSTPVSPDAQGAYSASVISPEKGWTAFFLEFTYQLPGCPAPLKFTTAVQVTPNKTPFTYDTSAHTPKR